MIISLIAAMDKNRVIGNKDDKLPWYLPADLKHFKSITLGKPIIMGRKTFETIGKPLPERTNIIITRDKNFQAPGCIVAHSPDEALHAAGNTEEIMIIGGGEIFSQFLSLAKRMYFTLVNGEFDGDIHFPKWNPDEWHEVFRETHEPDEKNPYSYEFITLERA